MAFGLRIGSSGAGGGGGNINVTGTGLVHVVSGTIQSTASPVDLNEVSSEITGTLPAANGGTGLASAGGIPNRVVLTEDGTTFTVAQVGDSFLTATGVASGTYGTASSVPVVTMNATGRVTNVTTASIQLSESQVTGLVSDLANKIDTPTQVIAGTGLSGGGALSSNVTLSLPSVGTAGSYGSATKVPVITTDAQGRISNVVETTISGVAPVGNAGGDLTGSFPNLTLKLSGTAGTYGSADHFTNIATDSSGRVKQIGTNLARVYLEQVTGLVAELENKADESQQVIAGTGLSGGGYLNVDRTLSLPNVGTSGSYGSSTKVPVITTDAQGRVTGVVETTITGAAPSGSAGGDLSGTYPNPTLTMTGSAGTYGSDSAVPVVMTNDTGRVTSVTPASIQIAESQVTNLVTDLSNKVDTTRQVIAGTGLSGGGALSSNVTLSLPNVGTAGSYGSATQVPVITTDAQGRITGVVATAITSGAPGGSTGGDLSGSYPNPAVAKLQTRAVSSAAPSLNDLLTWNGTSWAPAASTSQSVTTLSDDGTGFSSITGQLIRNSNSKSIETEYDLNVVTPTTSSTVVWSLATTASHLYVVRGIIRVQNSPQSAYAAWNIASEVLCNSAGTASITSNMPSLTLLGPAITSFGLTFTITSSSIMTLTATDTLNGGRRWTGNFSIVDSVF